MIMNTQNDLDASIKRHPAGNKINSAPMLRTYRIAYKIDSPAAETKIQTILIVDGYSTLADATKIISLPMGIDSARIKIIGTPKLIKVEVQS